MTTEIWLAILSSSVISGILGALIAGWFTLHGQRNDYENEYFKTVLSRRIAAYEEIEQLISLLKTAVVDTDQRPYHLLFATDDTHDEVYKPLLAATSKALWISDDLFQMARDLNIMVFDNRSSADGMIEFGKKNYKPIAELRTRMEKAHVRDMLTLHQVSLFLKSKKPTDSYQLLDGPR